MTTDAARGERARRRLRRRRRRARSVASSVGSGEIVGLIGPNGAGQVDDAPRDHGRSCRPAAATIVLARQRRSSAARPEDVARAGVALVPEGRHIFAELTVEENLRLGLAGRRSREGRQATSTAVYELFPIGREFRQPAGGRAVRRPAAAARDRAGARRAARRAAARRAVARALADRRRHRLRGARPDPRPRASRSCSSSSAPSARWRSPTGPT